MALQLVPMGLREANAWVDEVHRHHGPVTGHKWSVGVELDGRLVGVAIAGRPVARKLQEQGFLEVVRVATDGTDHVCSMLYGAMARAGQALGYPKHKIITYTLESESGASLRAAGWVALARSEGGSWSRPSRGRQDKHPLEPKIRWHAGTHPKGPKRTADRKRDA